MTADKLADRVCAEIHDAGARPIGEQAVAYKSALQDAKNDREASNITDEAFTYAVLTRGPCLFELQTAMVAAHGICPDCLL